MSNGLRDNYGAEIGMRVTCQRCGAQVFRKQTGYNTMDAASSNRHSFLDVFEPMPGGWKLEVRANGWLCPKCAESFNNILQKFMAETQEFMNGGADNA